MDAIKKKMQSLKTETENAMARADQLDAEFRAATTLAEKTEETVRKSKESDPVVFLNFRSEIFRRRCNMWRMSWTSPWRS